MIQDEASKTPLERDYDIDEGYLTEMTRKIQKEGCNE